MDILYAYPVGIRYWGHDWGYTWTVAAIRLFPASSGNRKPRMRACAYLLLSLLLGACASVPVAPPVAHLFHDQLFQAPTERAAAGDIFVVSESMKQFLRAEIGGRLHGAGIQQRFAEALYTKGELRIDYESVRTRTAAETFEARAGNCLSLVIMTAALAKEIGLPVRYQRVYVDDTFTRTGDVTFSVGHVNISLGRRHIDGAFGHNDGDMLTIDFLPPRDLRGVHTRQLEEETIAAMYMNNRAAEAFALGKLDDAYWWARAGIEQDPAFVGSYNTLGVVYRRHGNPQEAERALVRALELEPRNTDVMANLVPVLASLGRVAESKELARTLEQLEPNPPFSYFDRGLAAIQGSDFEAARDLIAQEIARAPYHHEFHYWLAVAYAGLGDRDGARKELRVALEMSTTGRDRAMYAAKLDRIRASSAR
jgi:Flp pilus assembly protein TadD